MLQIANALIPKSYLGPYDFSTPGQVYLLFVHCNIHCNILYYVCGLSDVCCGCSLIFVCKSVPFCVSNWRSGYMHVTRSSGVYCVKTIDAKSLANIFNAAIEDVQWVQVSEKMAACK